MTSDWYDLSVATNTNGVATGTNGGQNAYTSEDGSKGTGWVYTENAAESDSYWYYLVSFKDDNGTVRNLPFNSQSGDSSWRAKVIKSKTYIFNAKGEMQDGLVDLGSADAPNVYGKDKDGNVVAVADYKGGAISKAMADGVYYFNENSGSVKGQMVTGKTTVVDDGETYNYYFDKSTGRAITAIVKDGVVYGDDGDRIQADDGNSNEIVSVDYAIAYSKSKVDVVIDGKTVKGIPANSRFIVSSSGKLRTSGTVKVDGIRYQVNSANWTLKELED